MLSPFLGSPLKIFYPLSPLPLLTNPSLLPGPGIPLHWGLEPPLDQEAPLPWMSDKAILCYISSWSHGPFYLYSLVGGLVLGSSGGIG